MAALVDHVASPHLANLVNAIRELISAILDGDLCLAVRHIAAVDVCNA